MNDVKVMISQTAACLTMGTIGATTQITLARPYWRAAATLTLGTIISAAAQAQIRLGIICVTAQILLCIIVTASLLILIVNYVDTCFTTAR